MKQRRIIIRMIAEYEVEVPFDWDSEMIEFHRNESSWCATNGLEELTRLIEKGCQCSCIEYEFVREAE